MKIVSHHSLRRRCQVNCSEPVLTDQSFKKSCDINNIMKQYAKTGMLPHFNKPNPQFIDNTQVLPLVEAFDRVREARELFYELPANVRKAMDNDPSQMESFIADPDNHSLLVKHGVLIEKKEKVKEPLLTPQDIENLKESFKFSDKKSE